VGRTGSARGEGRVGAHGRGRRARARAGEGRRRERRGEERGIEGDLTSGLDDWRQPLTGIPPRARGGGREVEKREREVATWEKKMKERRDAHGGRGARLGEAGSGQVTPRARLGRGPGRQPTTRTRLPIIEFKSRIENQNETNEQLDTTLDKRNMLRMMQHPCQLRFLFTRDMDTSLYTALKMGRRGKREEKRE
jgi:hypothetical protein